MACMNGDPLDSLVGLGNAIRANLEEGGPPLDYALVVDYIDGRLEGATKDTVCYRISRYRKWNDAYREVSLIPPCPES
jgi:hypothetical protein